MGKTESFPGDVALTNGASLKTPQVVAIDGRAVTTSMAMAEFFGKRHDNVVNAIRETRKRCSGDPELLLNFKEHLRDVKYANGSVHREPYFLLTRDAFTLVAMGFTGKRAFKWKVAYIKAFNAMERALLSGKRASPFVFGGVPVRALRKEGTDYVAGEDVLTAFGMDAAGFRWAGCGIQPDFVRFMPEGPGEGRRIPYLPFHAVVLFCTRGARNPERGRAFLAWLASDVIPKLREEEAPVHMLTCSVLQGWHEIFGEAFHAVEGAHGEREDARPVRACHFRART